MSGVGFEAGEILRDVRDLIARCARYDVSDPKVAESIDGRGDLNSALEAVFSLMAAFLCGAGDGGWSIVSNHPGYVGRDVGSGEVVVPFHLVVGMPDNESLRVLRGIADEMRAGSGSAICLSGSVVTLGDPRTAGDVDFCEYIPESEFGASIGRLRSRWKADRRNICRRGVALAGERFGARVGASVHGRLRSAALKARWSNAFAKVDYLVDRRATGPIEATNVLVWLPRDDPDRRAASRSHPYQEFLIGFDRGRGFIPRRLALPSNVARYVRFLRGQIDRYRRTDTLKALKRSLSLASFLMLSEHRDAIVEFGRERGAFGDEALRQRRKLMKSLQYDPDIAIRRKAPRMRASLYRWTSERKAGGYSTAAYGLRKDMADIIDRLCEDVDDIMRE